MSLTQFSDQYITDRFTSAHYTLIHKIGEGGFGKVFKAKNNNTGQFVAIKFLALDSHLEEHKKQRYIERFKRETALSSKLEHPHIVRLLDKGQIDDNLLFGVFEYIDGISLRQHLTQEGALNAIDATDVMLQVLDALIHAHGKGIIHRDIKPANIMLAKSGAKTYAKILDFGIGTLVSEHRQPDFNTLTLTQETLGTPSYSAPEQLRGEPATTQTDLYVWGLVFLECLTGQPAVSGSSIASIYHKQLSDVNVSLPAPLLGHPLAALFRRVLKKNAIERVITTQESYNELNSINVANLVGILTKGGAQHGFDDETVVLRKDAQENSSANHTLLTERKQITVLALKISITEVSTNTKDLDVIDALNKAQLNQCVDIATRFNAYHVGTLGDMLLFYFGFPVASDNDTRLSARTALEIMSEMSKRDALMQEAHGISFNIHIGLHTGMFVTYANAIPEGHITNTAMELARFAKPKQILCSGDSRAILEPYSEFESINSLVLPQPGSPQTVYSLKGERQVEAFGFMRGTRNNHELIGREIELDKTLSVVKQTENSHIAHIHGEAGIGKSRLLQEVRSHAAHYQHLVAQCLPEHQNNALYPVLTLIRYLFNTPQLNSNAAIDLFTELLKQQNENINVRHALPILFIWLNIPLPEDMQASSMSPEHQKVVLFDSLAALLLNKQYSISDNKLYIIEDIHWADTTTIEFIEHFASQLTSGHVLISTSRQQVPTALKDLTLMEVNLQKLTEQATKDFIIKLFDNQPVANNVLDILISRTDGIPLFIEELVGMLKQKALISVIAGEMNFISPDKLDQVPSSLRESLQQKLDSLVHAKETAQLAATIGREFEYDLLVAASSLSENQIQNDLNELIANNLIVQQRRVNNDSYIFKHALVRDTAYESMSKSKQIDSHRNIADNIELIKDTNSDNIKGLLASHLKSAKEFLRSAKYTQEIAKVAMSKSIYSQATYYANDTINSLENVEGTEVEQLDINQVLTTSSMMVSGWASKEVEKSIKRSQTLLKELKDDGTPLKVQVLWALATYQNVLGQHLEVESFINDALNNTNHDEGEKAALLALLAHTYWQQGKLEEAVSLSTQALALYDMELHSDHSARFGHDTKSFAQGLRAMVYSNLGEFEKSKVDIKVAIEHAQHLKSHHSICMAKLYNMCCLYNEYACKEIPIIAKTIFNICKKEGISNWIELTQLVNEWALSFEPDHKTTLDLNATINNMLSYGMTQLQGFWNAMVAEIEINNDQLNSATSRISKMIQLSIERNDLLPIPTLYKLLGKCALLVGDKNEAKKQFIQALEYSENLNMQYVTTTLQENIAKIEINLD